MTMREGYSIKMEMLWAQKPRQRGLESLPVGPRCGLWLPRMLQLESLVLAQAPATSTSILQESQTTHRHCIRIQWSQLTFPLGIVTVRGRKEFWHRWEKEPWTWNCELNWWYKPLKNYSRTILCFLKLKCNMLNSAKIELLWVNNLLF